MTEEKKPFDIVMIVCVAIGIFTGLFLITGLFKLDGVLGGALGGGLGGVLGVVLFAIVKQFRK